MDTNEIIRKEVKMGGKRYDTGKSVGLSRLEERASLSIRNCNKTMGRKKETVETAKRPEQVVTIGQKDTVAAAARRMRKNHIGCLPVVDAEGRLVGILSERDILNHVAGDAAESGDMCVEQIMITEVISCPVSTSMFEAHRIMTGSGIRHLPLVSDGFPAGMISSREIMAYQHQKDNETRDLTIFAMAKVAESRDPETGGHLERVRGYAGALARQLATADEYSSEITPDFVRLMYATCPLHDVGKVAIPDCVLLKPGRLDDREFQIMKTHTTEGAAALDSALRQYPEAKFLNMARDIAAGHHERMDGHGYPDGLAGRDIPLCARIFAPCDVYDALVSKRVYKEAFTHDVARSIILEGRGTQFDADVVDAFRQCEQEFYNIQQRHRDARAAA